MSDEGKDDGFSISTSTDFRIRGIGQLGPALRALGGLVAVCVIAWVSDFSAEEAGRLVAAYLTGAFATNFKGLGYGKGSTGQEIVAGGHTGRLPRPEETEDA